MNYKITIGCVHKDNSFSSIRHCNVIRVIPEASKLHQFAKERKIDFIVAHTSPFFEILTVLQSQYPCWAWEHGDPTPELFSGENAENRISIKNTSRIMCILIYKV